VKNHINNPILKALMETTKDLDPKQVYANVGYEIIRLLDVEDVDKNNFEYVQTHVATTLAYFADLTSMEHVLEIYLMVKSLNEGLERGGKDFVKDLKKVKN